MGRNRNKSKGVFWQSSAYNSQVYTMYFDELLALAINRFRWVGLPDTCDEWFLERKLHENGMATICHSLDMPDVWQSLIAAPCGDYNAYGYPVKWNAFGYAGKTNYKVELGKNGELVYYSRSRRTPWLAIQVYANKLTHYSRTEDINLAHQHKPYLMLAPREKQQELVNIYKQIAGYEPAILGDKNLEYLKESVTAIDTKVPLITEDLARCQLNVLNSYLLYIGIPHLAFEKGERMIEDEARANTAPTNIMLLDCLNARRDACKKLRQLDPKRFGDLNVYFNDDWESYNFNYINNVESMAQDGLLDEVNGNE